MGESEKEGVFLGVSVGGTVDEALLRKVSGVGMGHPTRTDCGGSSSVRFTTGLIGVGVEWRILQVQRTTQPVVEGVQKELSSTDNISSH